MSLQRNVAGGLLMTMLVASVAIESRGQEQAAAAAAFAVASIHENHSGDQDGFVRFENGRFSVTNLQVRWMIRWAYALRDYQVVGLPNWTETRYDIQATYTPPSAGADAIRVMVQRLLADRFALQTRHEPREMRVYQLVKAHDGRGLGPKMTPSNIDCEAPAAQPSAPLEPGQRPVPRCTAWVTYGMVHGFSRTMAQLSRYLDDVVGAPVVDRTGLTGYWDFDVQWSVPTTNEPPAEMRTPPVESIAGLFPALQEQVGLKLTTTRGPVDVLIIDSVSRPTPD
jgi:uncharacterized protein (TIGR03435 family)